MSLAIVVKVWIHPTLTHDLLGFSLSCKWSDQLPGQGHLFSKTCSSSGWHRFFSSSLSSMKSGEAAPSGRPLFQQSDCYADGTCVSLKRLSSFFSGIKGMMGWG